MTTTTMGNNPKQSEYDFRRDVGDSWFGDYDYGIEVLGKIDFCVTPKYNGAELFDKVYFLWAESKLGKSDVNESFVQLILTIGKARTFDKYLPPMFLGAFDAEKFAFLPYNKIMDIFGLNDFNWNVAPSDHNTKEFKLLEKRVEECLDTETLLFRYDEDGKELRKFIKDNFIFGKSSLSKIQINKNNFTHIYLKWRKEVMPTIENDWEETKKEGLLDADFYLADILSRDNESIREKLYVVLCKDRYNMKHQKNKHRIFEEFVFIDGQKAHTRFWLRYSRPPKEEYWDYIIERRDLLVPQDIRERKGSFFTPVKWVELSQEYIARELGEDWQDEYYVWDCCAGTGNLLVGLTNKYNIYASTLDMADVKVMKELIESNSINLLDEHVFQFDFLNDDFSKLPPSLLDIINDPQKRKKLIIYINPPYAEAGNVRQRVKKGENRPGVARGNMVERKYRTLLGNAGNELFAQFFMRIYMEIPGCVLAEFSTLKILQGDNFGVFRNRFHAELFRCFVVPANTFDNVKGQFPIGFFIWDTSQNVPLKSIVTDVYDRKGDSLGTKKICVSDVTPRIGNWLMRHNMRDEESIGNMNSGRNDFQNQNLVYIANHISSKKTHAAVLNITQSNIIVGCVYFAVRQCIEATWLNDRDQFFTPNDSWEIDKEFQSDCLAYTLFHGQNRISSTGGTNHWIPFTEEEVGAKERFGSHFMSEYIHGKRKPVHCAEEPNLFATPKTGEPTNNTDGKPKAIVFSREAQAVMDAGRELWKYYHSQPKADPDASYYDIRLHFQGTDDRGKMNPDSPDPEYSRLVRELRSCLRVLARKIEPKVYEHGFLLK